MPQSSLGQPCQMGLFIHKWVQWAHTEACSSRLQYADPTTPDLMTLLETSDGDSVFTRRTVNSNVTQQAPCLHQTANRILGRTSDNYLHQFSRSPYPNSGSESGEFLWQARPTADPGVSRWHNLRLHRLTGVPAGLRLHAPVKVAWRGDPQPAALWKHPPPETGAFEGHQASSGSPDPWYST